MTKKVLSVFLALLMMLTVLPVAFAEDTTAAEEADILAEDRVAAWEANYGMILDYLFENTDHIGWNYVFANNEEIVKLKNTYTAFALYDDAWKNYFDNSVDMATAEEVLLALIDRVQSDITTDRVNKIREVLDGATDIADLVEKVNSFVKISDEIGGETWNSVFQYIGYAQDALAIYSTRKAELIEALARILSVKEANEYFVDYLNYVKDNCKYTTLANAAAKLLTDIDKSMEELMQELNVKFAEGTTASVLEIAAKVAMNTNVYTAAVLTVYNTATSIADTLWNTSDQYDLMDNLYCTFYAETACAEWATLAMAGDDANKKVFAVSALITLRDADTDILEALKVAQSQGIIGRIKNKINKQVTAEYTVENAKLEAIRKVFFTVNPDDYKEVTGIYSIFCPVDVIVKSGDETVYTIADGNGELTINEYGIFAEAFCDYSEDFLKVAFVYGDEDVALLGKAAGVVSAVVDLKGAANIWSFTEVPVAEGTVIEIAKDGTYAVDGLKAAMNDHYLAPAEKETNVETVTDAVVEVGKEEVKSFLDKIKEFFQKIIAIFTNLFKKK